MSWSSVPQVVDTTLNIWCLIASTKKLLVPVAHKQAGNDSQLVTFAASPDTLSISVFMSLSMSLAKANFVAVNPPADDIWSISDFGLLIAEKS